MSNSGFLDPSKLNQTSSQYPMDSFLNELSSGENSIIIRTDSVMAKMKQDNTLDIDDTLLTSNAPSVLSSAAVSRNPSVQRDHMLGGT